MKNNLDSKRKFKQSFDFAWNTGLQYIRSTEHPNNVMPNLKEPVAKVMYDYACKTGTLPNMEDTVLTYKHILGVIKDKRVENFIGNKAKRKVRKKKRKERRAQRKAKGEKVGLGRFFQNIGKGGVNLALTPLLPLRKIMVEVLKEKGISASTKEPIRVVVSKFLKNVVKKEAPNLYPDGAVMQMDSVRDDTESAILPFIGPIISAIKNFIEMIQEKKQNGEVLKPVEEKILRGADTASKEIEILKKQEVEAEIGGFVNKNFIFIIVGLLGLGLLARGFSK